MSYVSIRSMYFGLVVSFLVSFYLSIACVIPDKLLSISSFWVAACGVLLGCVFSYICHKIETFGLSNNNNIQKYKFYTWWYDDNDNDEVTLRFY